MRHHPFGCAIEARARVVVLPCCHEKATCDRGGVDGWVDAPLAIDMTRAARLRAHGYAVYTQTIPATITPKNRLLMAAPLPGVDRAARAGGAPS